MDKLPLGEQTRVRALVDVLLTFDDFPTFAAMMVEHNLAMQRGEPSQLSKEAEASQAQCVGPSPVVVVGLLCLFHAMRVDVTCRFANMSQEDHHRCDSARAVCGLAAPHMCAHRLVGCGCP